MQRGRYAEGTLEIVTGGPAWNPDGGHVTVIDPPASTGPPLSGFVGVPESVTTVELSDFLPPSEGAPPSAAESAGSLGSSGSWSSGDAGSVAEASPSVVRMVVTVEQPPRRLAVATAEKIVERRSRDESIDS